MSYTFILMFFCILLFSSKIYAEKFEQPIPTCPDDKPLMDSNKACFSCDEETPVLIEGNPYLCEHFCKEKREIINNHCALKKTKSQYTIDEENTYTVLVNDLTKSYIEQLSQHKEEIEARLIVSFIKAHLNMSQIKKEVIPCLRKNNISIFSRKKIDLDAIEICAHPFTNHFKEMMEKLSAQKQPRLLENGLVALYIFDPRFREPFKPKTMPEMVMIKQASAISITRLNNQEWYQKINTCAQQKEKMTPPQNDSEYLNNVEVCSQPYFEAVSQETARIVPELKLYDSFFQMTVPLPNRSKMKQDFSKSGETYKWNEK